MIFLHLLIFVPLCPNAIFFFRISFIHLLAYKIKEIQRFALMTALTRAARTHSWPSLVGQRPRKTHNTNTCPTKPHINEETSGSSITTISSGYSNVKWTYTGLMQLAVNVCSLLPSPLHLSPSAPTSQSSQAGWSEHLCWPTTFLFDITLLLFVSQLKHPSFKHRWLSFSIILSHSFSLSFLMFCLCLFFFDILLIQPLICHACSGHVKRVATGATKDVEGSVSSRNICESGCCHKRSSFARDCPPFLSLIHAEFCVFYELQWNLSCTCVPLNTDSFTSLSVIFLYIAIWKEAEIVLHVVLHSWYVNDEWNPNIHSQPQLIT